MDDLLHRGGMPLKVDRSKFTLGQDLAATPGEVIYRGELIEVMQYRPQTETVSEVPILMVPPWINKYYVMDLAPGRSLIEWAVQHGRTVFTISYRNPDESMSALQMDDYLQQGPLTALSIVQAVTGSDRVDLVALCLGGALAAMTTAYLAQDETSPISSLTLLNTELDYSDPGILAVAVDPDTLAKIDKRMAERGYLPAEDMSRMFDQLRSNDLIFNYVVSRWMMGEEARPFDILAWNDDSTRMPAAMHSHYLRSLYGENQLARGEYELGGRRLDLHDITCDAYVVGAINDHIVPWKASYRATALFGGDVRYVLSSGGHIAGVVNPPTPKAWFQSNEKNSPDAEVWLAGATRRTGSWWEDWTAWSAARSGGQRKPPSLGNRRYRPLAPAPGTYVFGAG
ncbi:poly(3-hydroxyalkanoate) synthetase [Flexivirga oryzae]|uniref:Poly(3-hydroxyalkanoate) synthetase n=1 Tax=Flexivirga oryzae TaxID=1794944 RepID=A0A839N5H3_9MICO|nr:poly(3-hydroxyalkanoate) synthetase [Flexivirga oryzae]